ncbi:unnamed protein product [Rhizoctonia solani]|uniref:Uncharacterized protein n=1 Tax=Rhizoctonia solani TaxID=456999 RepID=A0A8H3CEH9_9AGAM|nr:unnamed protein product [Rhizoctonia solani]
MPRRPLTFRPYTRSLYSFYSHRIEPAPRRHSSREGKLTKILSGLHKQGEGKRAASELRRKVCIRCASFCALCMMRTHPKFIARSISIGELLDEGSLRSRPFPPPLASSQPRLAGLASSTTVPLDHVWSARCPQYVAYKKHTFNLESKINTLWSTGIGLTGRLRVQNQLHCCDHSSPYVEATISQTCYSRSSSPTARASISALSAASSCPGTPPPLRSFLSNSHA